MTKALLMVLSIILLAPTLTAAATAKLAWDANVEPDLAGYKIYRATVDGGPYVTVATLGKVTSWDDTSLADGFYCWVATAYDTVGNESGYSNQVCLQVDSQPPAAPNSLRLTGVVR